MRKYWQERNTISVNTLPPTALRTTILENVYNKKSLNGRWYFKFFQSVNEVSDAFFTEDFNCYNEDIITVPSEWQIQGYDTPIYTNTAYPYPIITKNTEKPEINDVINPAGIYFTDFIIGNEDYSRLRIDFNGINSCGIIYVNGQFVGFTESTFDIASFDITNKVKVGKNRLTVLVVRYSIGSFLEDQDMWRLSGIMRDVDLVFEPKARIDDAFLSAKFTDDYSVSSLNAKLTLGGDYSSCKVKIQCDELSVSSESNSSQNVCFEINDLKDVVLWSHENPKLYDFYLLLTENETIVDRRKISFGFRKIEICPKYQGNQPTLLLNGKMIKICGVNRHDFHPDYGHAVPDEVTYQDLLLLKRNNITSVRTSHYPGTRFFYESCDKLGILVMSENNLETHGIAKRVPHNSELWTTRACNRLESMINSFKNHPSIVFWSLGNESGIGKAFYELRKTALELDDTRLIHYEPMHEVSDVLSEMYTSQSKMKKIANNKTIIHSRAYWNNAMGYLLTPKMYKHKPFLLCEYAHCMGNSLGNFTDYWKDFEENARLIGGYIWDFADQSIKRIVDGETQWTMGGDWGDKPNDGVFAFNGIVRADRTPNPALYEVKKLYARVIFTLEGRILTIKNRQSFTDLSDYVLVATSLRNGIEYSKCELAIPETLPLSESKIVIPDELIPYDGEIALNLDLYKKTETPYSSPNHLVAYEQFILKTNPLLAHICLSEVPNLVVDKKLITVRGDNFEYVINKESGEFLSLTYKNVDYISSPFKPLFWRAYTNNDGYPPMNGIDFSKILWLKRFRSANRRMRHRKTKAKINDNCIVITSKYTMPFNSNVKVSYKIFGDGSITIKLSFFALTNLVRYGITFNLPKNVDGIEFYGYGPNECYIDRKDNARLGIYKGLAQDFIHDYLYPQENGNHIGIRSLKLGIDHPMTVKAIDKPFEASIHPYTIDELDNATHLHELVKSNTLTVNIDGGQRGVGGDLPCCSWLKKKYRLLGGKRYTLEFEILFD